jgi:tryptophan halogenase
VGVGEGTTVGFTKFLNELDLDEFDVMREAGGTIKSGISFENWNGDKKKYFHSFRGYDIFSLPPHFGNACEKYHFQTLLKEGLDFNEYVYVSRLAYRNEVDLYNGTIAMHMDNFKLGTYLRSIGAERNIICVDGNFNHVEVDENNFIQKLCLDDGRAFECDFIFDCSGFAKLLIGKHYQTDWTSYKDVLPMDKAITFRLDLEEDIKPYTQAIAMNAGWMWKIPVKDRIGAGYVFDSDFLDDGEAMNEVQQSLSQPLSNVSSIPFQTGTHKQFWVKNCISIGLSSHFIEPLEATSLDVVLTQLLYLKKFLPYVFKHNEKITADYNKITFDMVEAITHFIWLHYLTKKSDTEFWDTFQERHPVPQKFEGILQSIYNNTLNEQDVGEGPIHQIPSFLEVCNGLELFQQPMDMEGYENLTPSVVEYKEMNNARIRDSTNITKHTDFLAGLYGPERLGSPFGPLCYCEPEGQAHRFHRIGE